VLGVSKPVIIGHGISKAKAFMNMIRIAEKMIETDVMSKMKKEVES
jgi:glycerol-3-phosphate acyltransferase PlsX